MLFQFILFLKSALRGFHISNLNELRKIITQLKTKIQKTKQKIAAVTGNNIEETISEVCIVFSFLIKEYFYNIL